MRIYYSGSVYIKDDPEAVIPEKRPHIMLTFYEIYQRSSWTTDRFKKCLKIKRDENKKRRPPK